MQAHVCYYSRHYTCERDGALVARILPGAKQTTVQTRRDHTSLLADINNY